MTKTVVENCVVSMNYTLTDEQGNILDASQGEPLEYLQGHQNIIPGLEKALTGLGIGEKKKVEVPPQDGYGDYNPALKFTVTKEQFGGQTPDMGSMVQLSSTQGQSFVAEVISVEQDNITLDANHPLAGKTLFFDVEIMDVRSASDEELQHGHPHGPHGHHH